MTDQSELVERVARAIYESEENASGWDDAFSGTRSVYRRNARAAIAAMGDADGYRIVPREPTPAMIIAGVAERHGQPVPEAWSLATVNIWRAMFDAAQERKP